MATITETQRAEINFHISQTIQKQCPELIPALKKLVRNGGASMKSYLKALIDGWTTEDLMRNEIEPCSWPDRGPLTI